MGNVAVGLLDDEPTTVVMMGLPFSGKSCLLQYLVGESSSDPQQPQNLSSFATGRGVMKTAEIRKIRFCGWDSGPTFPVGGCLALQNAKAIVFVVDSSDRESLPQAKEELLKVLCGVEEWSAVSPLTPLLVMANKADQQQHLSVMELAEALGLGVKSGGGGKARPWLIQPTSAITGSGVIIALNWLKKEVTAMREVGGENQSFSEIF